jgi:hypothetical protein
LSHYNGHHGPLSATFCRIDDTHYEVRFRGRFLKVVPFRYNVVLEVTGYSGDKVLLSGASNLGPILGTFSYSAEATDTQFVASFCACKDHGVFSMTRCCCP